jgi:hypothetical protein
MVNKMVWFNIIKGLTPQERRQTIDFWPKENKGMLSGYRSWPKERKAAYIRIRRRHKREGKPAPTIEEVEEELSNPIRLPSGGRKGMFGEKGYPHKGKKNINGIDTRPGVLQRRKKEREQ